VARPSRSDGRGERLSIQNSEDRINRPVTITFIPITADLSTSLADPQQFEAAHAVQLGEQADLVREVVGQNLEFLATVPRDTPWGAYLTVDDASHSVVGTCAFKSGPTPERIVELAYYTFPAYEGRGFGTAMARKLCRIADESGQIHRVIAHTLPEPNASNSLLRKVGFHHFGEVIDPEDGRIWRFERVCHGC
jgi:ribosomal-protein-alanine N-acetyltransferase